MNEFTNTYLVTFTTVLAVALYSFKAAGHGKKYNWLETIYALAFIVSPAMSFNQSVQAIIYPSDLIAVFLTARVILQKLQSTSSVRTRGGNYVAIGGLLLFGIPIIGTIYQMVVAIDGLMPYILSAFLRAILAFGAFVCAKHDVENGRIDVNKILKSGAVGFGILSFFGCAQYFANFSTDIFAYLEINTSLTNWTEGYGGGVLGLYRGEYGGIAGVFVGITIINFSATTKEKLFAASVVAAIIYVTFSVGSRQGIIGCAIALSFSIAWLWRNGIYKTRDVAILVITLTFLLVGFLIVNPAGYDWIISRFDIFSDSAELVQEASTRDARTPEIVGKVFGDVQYYLLGVGYGNVSEYLTPEPWVMIYVDSELVWVLQQHGIIGLGIYLVFLVAMIANLALMVVSKHSNLSFASLMNAWLVGFSMIYGHYLMLNFATSHAPIAAMYWIFAGFTIAQLQYRSKAIALRQSLVE